MGEVFAGRYELVDPIGRGGVGEVWRAFDHRRRRYVAAKVLQQSDAHALLRFVREQAMRIDHPNVLAPASWAADDDKVLFTMDLVRGGSLPHLVGDYGPLPPRLVCVLLDQLLSGLAAVHAEDIVHRDVKPANVLLEATGLGTPHVRLSDFGIAMRKGDPRLTEPDYVVGTPGYFAPEQLLGAEPDFPADLYAAGLVALYLLSGQKPDAQAVQDRFLAMGMPPAPVGVPEPLWQVVGTLLQPDPYARFRTATGARKALVAAIELMPEPAPGEEPVEVFDQIGPLPEGFDADGPLTVSPHLLLPEPQPAPMFTPQPAAARPVEPVDPSPPEPEEAGEPGEPAGGAFPAREEQSGASPARDGQAGEAFPAPPYEATPPYEAAPPYEATPLPASEQPLTHTRTRLDAPAHPLAHPGPGPLPPAASAADTASTRLPARRPRPGPPARVVIPMLVMALVCFAVGFAALAASS